MSSSNKLNTALYSSVGRSADLPPMVEALVIEWAERHMANLIETGFDTSAVLELQMRKTVDTRYMRRSRKVTKSVLK